MRKRKSTRISSPPVTMDGYNNGKEILKQTGVDYIKSFDPSTNDFPELGELQRKYGVESNPKPSSGADYSLKNLLHDSDVPRGCDPNSLEFDVQLGGGNSKIGSGDRDETLSGIMGSLKMGELKPQWIRPCPPRYPVHQSELLWIDPGYKNELVWDEKMCADTDLLGEGSKETLSATKKELVSIDHGNKNEHVLDVKMCAATDLLGKGLKKTLSATKKELVSIDPGNKNEHVLDEKVCAATDLHGKVLEETLSATDQELLSIDPGNKNELVLDDKMCAVRDLLGKGLKETLSAKEQEDITRELENEPKFFYHCGITSGKLPQLVKHNHQIAVAIVTELINSQEIDGFFDALVDMAMSPHSMEVVNRLTTAVELPKSFVCKYITKCISSCENAKHQDKYMQNMLVRLVCVLLYNLIRNKIIEVKKDAHLFRQVEGFCMDFSRIREADQVLRLLKTKTAKVT